MSKNGIIAGSIIGAAGLIGSAAGVAFAGQPTSLLSQVAAHKDSTVRGNLTVTGGANVKKTLNIVGRATARGGVQVWNGLSVQSNGLMVRSGGLNVVGTIQAQSAIFSQNLQAENLQATSINGGTLVLSGGATLGGAVTSSGRVTSNGLDAGSGGLTTSGNINAGTINGTSIASSGGISGAVGTFSNLNATGNVDFSRATVTGLNLSSLNLSSLALQTLNLGSVSGTAPPLTLNANGHTFPLSIDSSGALTLGAITSNGPISTTGDLTIGGTLTAHRLQAPAAIGSTNPGDLVLQGSTIGLTGDVAVTGGTTLNGGLTLGNNSHILAAGNGDVAGATALAVTTSASPTSETTQTVTFSKVYATAPVVTLTAAGDPAPSAKLQGGATGAPKVWVTLTTGTGGSYTGFVIHYLPPANVTQAFSVTYNYHVIGS